MFLEILICYAALIMNLAFLVLVLVLYFYLVRGLGTLGFIIRKRGGMDWYKKWNHGMAFFK
jgi:hypothetical protein